MSKTINILISIDTDSVKKSYPNPSQDPNHATGIGHNLGYMVATGTTVNSGQGTGDLNFNALVGDTDKLVIHNVNGHALVIKRA